MDNNAWMNSGVIFRVDKRQISLPYVLAPTAGAAFEIYDFLTIGNRLSSGFIIWLANF